jgi:hypothetical protein
MKLSLTASVVVFCVLLAALLGCNEPGRVRVSDQELFGTYTTVFDDVTLTKSGRAEVRNTGKEQLTLRPDKTYVQVFSSPEKQFTNTGNWTSSGQFLSGTRVELLNFNAAEYGSSGTPPHYESLYLFVHKEQGKLGLARSEKREWYYDRVQ